MIRRLRYARGDEEAEKRCEAICRDRNVLKMLEFIGGCPTVGLEELDQFWTNACQIDRSRTGQLDRFFLGPAMPSELAAASRRLSQVHPPGEAGV